MKKKGEPVHLLNHPSRRISAVSIAEQLIAGLALLTIGAVGAHWYDTAKKAEKKSP